MPQLSEKSRTAKVGSNVKAHKALLAHDARANDIRMKPLVQLRKKAARERKAFFRRNVLRVVNDIAQSSRDAFNVALLKAKGDGDAIVRARRKQRSANDRALTEKIPGFVAFQKAQLANWKMYQKLIARNRAAAFDNHVDLGPGAVASEHLDDKTFSAPYPLFDVETPGVGGFVRADGTFADPRLGIVLNQLNYRNDEHSSIFGFSNSLDVSSSAAVGANYTTPRSGQISCSAVVQNIYNYVTFSLTDNWGWSDGEVHFRILLFMRILRGNLLLASFDRLICENGLIARSGTDLHGVSFDDIDMSTPYTFSAKTQKILDPGENVQLLVGSRLEIGDTLNDMQARVNGTIGWQVKTINARTS